jgi:putative flippase GtrA
MAARFATVGASGYAVNVATLTAIVRATPADYRTAGAIAFLTAVANNFA